MNWSRIKSILIAVFVVVDVYLLIQYFAVNDSNDVISRTVVENTIDILQSRDVTVEKENISQIVERDPKTGENYKTSADALITFSHMAKNTGLSPCTVEKTIFEDGYWILTTNKGTYIYDAVNLNLTN
ncbi:MAG: hypothetical protein PHE51_10605 [Eubacteriales bacterium]|nr:hypothetical protein [Eubacteriales bacterium]